ncbi:TPA: DUF4105 domain-containing protein [Stenotrophomonas maltophilia]|uniref:Uncharacterized protein n=1 Tax=Stenotrophomonas maltophilia TaxID=40324 RepID=A0A2J0UA21_STEMA|nr:hypothetical protein B9Y64_16730 [Stenotrophomonas maltophilia]HDS1147813.1 DUF4105 domain-containing protein [Stenotrophomonas maltophilia]HDS1149271.1 DUF4105 domain-containing protein [Stenotrophomonas maltophilia]HDS1162429.1 DUF4105 domain-containing protein [Stenotrophomonas maltophilia]
MTRAMSLSVEPSHARLNTRIPRAATAAEHGSALQRRSGRRGWVAVLAWLFIPTAYAADRLQLDPSGLDGAQQQLARQTLADVQSLLPEGLLRALPAQVQVSWSDALPPDVHGRAFGGRIALRRDLLDDGVPGARRARRSALVHELTHVADRSGANWSRSARWRDLAGWQRKPWHLGRGDNAFRDRSPDAYELKDPAEYLAVNAEHFVLDDEFACRRPALAQWYQAHLGTPPSLPQPQCAAALPLLQADPEEGAASLLQLDPSRVYAVDYLFAEGSAQPMSRWGHSMLRLVICRPGRTPGPDCRLDLEYHRVLSFRAFVGDVQISNWRGLTGGYPSRLFVLPLQQVVDEYTKVELRGLQSLPLRLQHEEIAGLLERSAQVHWSYDGRYYFVSNNCAVETAKLLQAGVPRLGEAGLAQLSPRGLKRRLLRLGALDERVLADRSAAQAQGYYFASARDHYQQLFAVAADQLSLPARDVRGWLKLPAQQRAPWLLKGDLRASAGLLLLEQAAQRRAELRARDVLKRQLLAAPDSAQTRSLRGLLEQSGQWLRPGVLLQDDGYGLPLGEEQALLSEAVATASAQAVPAWQALRVQLRQQLPAKQRGEMDAIDANLAALGAHLRAQAASPATGAVVR